MYYWAYPAQSTRLATMLELATAFGYSLGIDKDVLPYLKACHVAEVPYVLGNRHLLAPDPYNEGESEEYDSMLVTKTQSMWVNFAKNGDPSVPSLGISWPEYGATGKTLVISSDGSISSENFNAENSEQLSSASSEEKTLLAQRLSEQSNLISDMVDYGISGCEIINGNLEAIASYNIIQKTDEPDPEDTVPEETTNEPNNSTPIQEIGSPSGGCSSGTGSLMILAVVGFVLKRRY